MGLSKYIKIYPYDEKPGYLLFYSTKKASISLLRGNILKSIEEGNLSSADQVTLTQLGLMVTNAAIERESILNFHNDLNSNNIYSNFIAVMNLNCNLSCLYCYEGTMKGEFYMSYETANALIDFIIKSLPPHKKKLNLDFYGGEPLLSAGLIEHISKKLKAFSEERKINFSFTLVTNGTLLAKSTATKLSSLGLKSVKITLDGPRSNHDKYRAYKSGAGSFDVIARNIRDACEIIKVGIGGNFNRDNYRDFPLLLDYLISIGLTPDKISNVKFDPIMKPDSSLSPIDFRDGCESINEPWLVEAGFMLREEILKRGFNTPKIIPAPCMVDIKDDFVINYDGSIYKCPGLIGREEFKVGDVESGIKDFSKSHNVNLWKNETCLNCEYLPLCFGGCRYMKLLRDGNIEGVDCKKQYLDTTLETFIMQNIKYRLKDKS